MIDYISANTTAFDCDTLLSNSRFQWKEKRDIDTEKSEWFKAEINHLTFYIILKEDKPPILKIQGSLPKFYFNNNVKDLYFTQFCEVVAKIMTLTSVPPEAIFIHCFEFGVNIEPLQSSTDIMKDLMLYNQIPFQIMKEKNHFKGRECSLSKFKIKCYDKGKQYTTSNNLLRFEIRVSRMAYMKSKGISISTLSDLQNINMWKMLQSILSTTYQGIVKRDLIDIKKVKKTADKEFILSFRDIAYTTNMEHNNFTENLQKYEGFKIRYSENNEVHKDIKHLIFNKVSYLLNPKKYPKYNNVTLFKEEEMINSSLLPYGIINTAKKVIKCYNSIQSGSKEIKTVRRIGKTKSNNKKRGNLKKQIRKYTIKQPIQNTDRICVMCGNSIQSKNKQAKTCSPKCRTKLCRKGNDL